MKLSSAVVLVICGWVLPTPAKYVRGSVEDRAENWIFLTRFCFLSAQGTFTYDVEYDMDFAVQNLLLYYDTTDQWTSAYQPGKSCEERESYLLIENNQIINLTSAFRPAECQVIRLNNDQAKYRCIGNRTFQSARERWWFIALSNCQSTKGLSLRYRFWMTNGPSNDIWFHHFSADEFYIFPMLIGFFLAQCLMLAAAVFCARELRSRQLLHSTYKIFITSVLLQAWALLFFIIAYGIYARDGVGSPFLRLLGRVLESTSDICYTLLLILIGKGYTVTRARLRVVSVVKVTTFMSLYCVTYISLFSYERMHFDPGKVLYVYESLAGYGLLVLRIIGWILFVYATAFTLKHYPEKNGFYLVFFIFASLWFVSGPVIIFLANHVVDKWVREKIMFAVQKSIALIGFVAFLLLTRPSNANKNFPYHVRTSQIGAIEQNLADAENNFHMNLDQFPHHSYEPTAQIQRSNNNGIYAITNATNH